MYLHMSIECAERLSQGAHLGTPLPRRMDKPGSKGSFELEQLAEADHDGRVRSRQRMLLSPRGAWAQSLAEAIHRAEKEHKTVAQILNTKLTPLDKVLGESMSPEVRWYVDTNCAVLTARKYPGTTLIDTQRPCNKPGSRNTTKPTGAPLPSFAEGSSRLTRNSWKSQPSSNTTKLST
jgi:hypothetical protein